MEFVIFDGKTNRRWTLTMSAVNEKITSIREKNIGNSIGHFSRCMSFVYAVVGPMFIKFDRHAKLKSN